MSENQMNKEKLQKLYGILKEQYKNLSSVNKRALEANKTTFRKYGIDFTSQKSFYHNGYIQPNQDGYKSLLIINTNRHVCYSLQLMIRVIEKELGMQLTPISPMGIGLAEFFGERNSVYSNLVLNENPTDILEAVASDHQLQTDAKIKALFKSNMYGAIPNKREIAKTKQSERYKKTNSEFLSFFRNSNASAISSEVFNPNDVVESQDPNTIKDSQKKSKPQLSEKVFNPNDIVEQQEPIATTKIDPAKQPKGHFKCYVSIQALGDYNKLENRVFTASDFFDDIPQALHGHYFQTQKSVIAVDSQSFKLKLQTISRFNGFTARLTNSSSINPIESSFLIEGYLQKDSGKDPSNIFAYNDNTTLSSHRNSIAVATIIDDARGIVKSYTQSVPHYFILKDYKDSFEVSVAFGGSTKLEKIKPMGNSRNYVLGNVFLTKDDVIHFEHNLNNGLGLSTKAFRLTMLDQNQKILGHINFSH